LIRTTPATTTSVYAAGVWCGVVRDLADGDDGDAQCRPEEHQGDDHRRERLGLPVAVGVTLVRGMGGDAKPAPDDERGEDVGRGLDGVGDQGVGVAEDPRQQFADDQAGVDQEARLGRPHPAFGPLR
jgi:hypothetical protein